LFPDRIITRKSHTEYSATKERAAFSHDDYMVIYREEDNATRAIYFDNEGHVIHYGVEFAADSDSVVFMSEMVPGAPRFRLTYVKQAPGRVRILFEIAPPGKPDAFSQYLDGFARRK
jgi:hypothetical protein